MLEALKKIKNDKSTELNWTAVGFVGKGGEMKVKWLMRLYV